MTNDVFDDTTTTTTTTELTPEVEMEIAGPPVRRRDETSARARRRLVAVAAALATVGVLWVVTGSPFDDPATSPTPSEHASPRRPASTAPPSPTQALDDLPQGLAPAIPYLHGGMLHVDGTLVPTRANRLLSAGGTVLLGRTREDAARWWILDGLDPVPLPELDGAFTPVLSPHGELVAWTSWPDKQTTRISVLDTTRMTEVDHLDLAAPFAACCGGGQEVELFGFDLRGRLYWTQRTGIQVWRPGSGTSPQRLSGAEDMVQLAAVGPVRPGGTLGRVDAHGRWSKIAQLPTDQGMLWSADGRLTAYGADDTGRVASKRSPTDQWVLAPVSGTRTHLDLPDGIRAEVVAFESDNAVLVDAFAGPRRHYLLRCSVSDGTCERTLPSGRPRWTFAERPYV